MSRISGKNYYFAFLGQTHQIVRMNPTTVKNANVHPYSSNHGLLIGTNKKFGRILSKNIIGDKHMIPSKIRTNTFFIKISSSSFFERDLFVQ